MNNDLMWRYPLEVRGYHTCLDDELDECGACLEVKNDAYQLIESRAFEYLEARKKEQEGLVYLFREWLDLVSPADFGDDEGQGVLV